MIKIPSALSDYMQLNYYDKIRNLNFKTNYLFAGIFILPMNFTYGDYDRQIVIETLSQMGIGDKNGLSRMQDRTLATILLYYSVKQISAVTPTLRVDPIVLSFTRYYKISGYDIGSDLKISFREYEGSPVNRTISTWAKMVYDPTRDALGLRNNYIGHLLKIELKSGISDEKYSELLKQLQGQKYGDNNNIFSDIYSHIKNLISNSNIMSIVDRFVVYYGIYPTVFLDYNVSNVNVELLTNEVTFTVERVIGDSVWQHVL